MGFMGSISAIDTKESAPSAIRFRAKRGRLRYGSDKSFWPSTGRAVNRTTFRMSKKHNVAIIGYGWAATAHIAAINASNQAQVTAVWSSRPLDSAELSVKHGSPIKAFT